MNAQERREVERQVESEREWLNHMEATNRSDLRHAMARMSPKGRAFAEFAMRMNDAKPRPRAYDPNVYLEIRERDASNREAHRDALTQWKARRS